MLGTPPPYNFSTSGVHPLHTSVLGIWLTKTLQLRYFGCAPPPYFGSRIIVPWDIPSLYGSRTPFSVLVYFSFLECLTSYRSFFVLCLGFEPCRHSSVDNTLTIKRFCLVAVWWYDSSGLYSTALQGVLVQRILSLAHLPVKRGSLVYSLSS